MNRLLGRKTWKYATIFAISLLITLQLSGCIFDLSEMSKVAISTDGKVAYRVSSHRSSAGTKPTIFLDSIDLSTNEVHSTYKLPAGFFHNALLFSQGTDTFLIIPQDERSGNPVPCNVYQCKPDSPPELISADEFYLTSQLNKPEIWHGGAVTIGKDTRGANALMYIQNKKVSIVSLDSLDEFSSGISSIQYHNTWNYFSDLNFFVIQVRLYDNREFYISPFLANTGMPIIEEVTGNSFGGEDTVVKIAQQYYGNYNKLIVRSKNDSSALLYSVPVINSSQMINEGILAETETLYHAVCLGIDKSSQLVLGYTGTNPELSPVTGYIYDMYSGNLTKLPVFGNMKLDTILFATSASTKQLLLWTKDSSRYEGTVFIQFPEGAPQYLSTTEFTETFSTQLTKLLGMTEFRVLSIIAGSFAISILIAFIVYIAAKRKRRELQSNELQFVEKRVGAQTLRKLLRVLGILMLMSFFVLLITIGEKLPTVTLALPILGLSLLLISRIAGSSSKRKAKNGILASATVVSIRRTGLTVNDQPQLEIVVKFVTEKNEEITAMAKAIIDLTDLALIQPGAMLPIRYDKDNPQNIIIEGKVDPSEHQAAFEKQMIAQGLISQESVDIARNGTKTQGVVLSSSPTGNIVNGWGEMSLKIRVTKPNNAGFFDTEVEKAIPPAMLPKILPGAVLNVYYMPQNEKNIVIELEL